MQQNKVTQYFEKNKDLRVLFVFDPVGDILNEIEAEVKRIMDECYKEAERILREKEDVLHRGAQLLLEKEKLNQEEFRAVYYGDDRRIEEKGTEDIAP